MGQWLHDFAKEKILRYLFIAYAMLACSSVLWHYFSAGGGLFGQWSTIGSWGALFNMYIKISHTFLLCIIFPFIHSFTVVPPLFLSNRVFEWSEVGAKLLAERNWRFQWHCHVMWPYHTNMCYRNLALQFLVVLLGVAAVVSICEE